MVSRVEFKLKMMSLPKVAVEEGEKKNANEWSIMRGCVRLALKQPVTVVFCPTSGSVTLASAVRTVKTTGGSKQELKLNFIMQIFC